MSDGHHQGRHMGSRWAAAASWGGGGVDDTEDEDEDDDDMDRLKEGLVGLGRTTVCGPRLEAVRATGFGGWRDDGEVHEAVACSRREHAGVRTAGGDVFGDGLQFDDGGVRLRARASAFVFSSSSLLLLLLTEMKAAAVRLLAAAGSWDSSARETDLARYSTSRRPTTESRPGSDNRKLHASLAQWLNPSCKKQTKTLY